MSGIENITARAQTPDQLIPYVRAVSGMESMPLDGAVLHRFENSGVLAAFSADDPSDPSVMNEAVKKALELKWLEELTVLGPETPLLAPEDSGLATDLYWGLRLDKIVKSSKLRNMLRRAAKEARIDKSAGEGAWTKEHAKLCEDFCKRKKESLGEDSVFLFGQMGKYLAGAPKARLFSARDINGALLACAIGDFSAFSTAFYMFAFRKPEAPPGTADLLLDAIVSEARESGYDKLNLGLGINGGVEFFKKKWGAAPLFPYVESKWKIKKKGWLARLLGRK